LPLEFLEDRNLLSQVAGVPAAEVQHDQVMVPFKGSMDYTIENRTLTTGLFQGTGQLTHMGRTTVDDLVVTPDFTTDPQHPTFTASGHFTAANGDKITFTVKGTFTSIDLTTATGKATSVATITGGTGRFKDATGVITTKDVLTLDLVPGQPPRVATDHQTLDGSISF
jgi:hypothetical protein